METPAFIAASPSGATNDRNVTIYGDGSATFAGGDISLNANGSATFVGNVDVGDTIRIAPSLSQISFARQPDGSLRITLLEALVSGLG